MTKGSQYGKFQAVTSSTRTTGSWLFYLFVHQFLYQHIQQLHQLEEILTIVVPVMPASELAHIHDLFLVYED